jgi:hypothetical protein
MKTASWVLLALAGVATLLLSLVSAARAYGNYNDNFGGPGLRQLSAGRPEVETALRSRRATAAAYGAGFATLFLLISVGPLSSRGKRGPGGRCSLEYWSPRC